MQAFGYSPENSFVSAPSNGSLAEVKVRLRLLLTTRRCTIGFVCECRKGALKFQQGKITPQLPCMHGVRLRMHRCAHCRAMPFYKSLTS